MIFLRDGEQSAAPPSALVLEAGGCWVVETVAELPASEEGSGPTKPMLLQEVSRANSQESVGLARVDFVPNGQRQMPACRWTGSTFQSCRRTILMLLHHQIGDHNREEPRLVAQCVRYSPTLEGRLLREDWTD